MTDRRVTERYIASTVDISQERVHSILIEDLEMKKLSARWVPRLLTVDQKHTGRTLSRTNLNLFEEDPANLSLWMKHGSIILPQRPNNNRNN